MAIDPPAHEASSDPWDQVRKKCEALPSDDREAQILTKLRATTIWSHFRYLMTEAQLRTALLVVLSAFFWGGLFFLFHRGFEFVVSHVGPTGETYHAQTVHFVFTLFFASLQVMLIFSSGIILYGGLFSSVETGFLLTLPVRDERLVLYRFQEALLFSSWGFFLLASPMMVAYGIVAAAPWWYFLLVPFFMVSFTYIPCALGAIGCLVLIHRLPQLRRIVVGLLALVVIGVAYQSIWKTLDMAQEDVLDATWFSDTFERFGFTRGEWLPSTWLSNGLLEAARQSGDFEVDNPWVESAKFLFVLGSNALLLHVVVMALGKRLFRSSYHQLRSRHARKRQSAPEWPDMIANVVMSPLPRRTRLLVVKDLRLFRRDPVQWSQFLIFFGLLLLYFANVDRFRQHRADLSVVTWVNVVSFLNLAVVGLILSTFTTRFIYPLISLEGRRFWILGRLPVDRETILWGKFLFAACGSWAPSAGLVLLSDTMLEVELIVVLIHQMICLLLCVGLAGMAVGLGAMMPNFREQSPSKIAAGFGGTLNLVLSALYIMLVVLMTALPCHFYLLGKQTELNTSLGTLKQMEMWLALGVGASLVLGVLVTIVPMRGGLRAFRQIEV